MWNARSSMKQARKQKDKDGNQLYPPEWFAEDNWLFLSGLREDLYELWHEFHKRHMMGRHDKGAEVRPCLCACERSETVRTASERAANKEGHWASSVGER